MAISERRRRTFTTIAVSLVVIVTGLLLLNALLPSTATTLPVVEIEIVGDSSTDWAFSPATITVPAGTTVTWVHKGSGSHLVIHNAVPPLFRFSHYLTNGSTYSITFTQPGVYSYYCFPHPQLRGEVIVY